VTSWHPATKALALLALLVLPYLLWTRSDETATPVVASVARAVTSDDAAEGAPTPPAAFELPPLEKLSEIVERPLFSPTRRMPVPAPRVASSTGPVAPAAPAASGPAEPELRFFGTVRHGGTAAALVTYPGTAQVARLQPGDQVGDWQVLSVDGNHLELGLGEKRRSFEIFASGTHGGTSAPDSPDSPDQAPGPEDEPTDETAPDAGAPSQE
jgi:hypothetical protein